MIRNAILHLSKEVMHVHVEADVCSVSCKLQSVVGFSLHLLDIRSVDRYTCIRVIILQIIFQPLQKFFVLHLLTPPYLFEPIYVFLR